MADNAVAQLLGKFDLLLRRLDTIESTEMMASAEHRAFAQRFDDAIYDLTAKYGVLAEAQLKRAVAKVAGIPELLEQILLELPMWDILRAQSVSKGFQATINGSVTLKRALFLTPEPLQGELRLNNLLPRPVPAFLDSLLPLVEGGVVKLMGPVGFLPERQHFTVDSVQVTGTGAGGSQQVLEVHCRRYLPCRYPLPKQAGYASSRARKICVVCAQYKDGAKRGSWEHMVLVQPSMPVHWVFEGEVKAVQAGGAKLGEILQLSRV